MKRDRKILSLNGHWLRIADPDDSGISCGFYKPDFDRSDWEPVSIPENWHLMGLENYTGVVWYASELKFEENAPGLTPWLRFHGIDYFADVWVDGIHCASHEGYFQPFEFPIPQGEKIRNPKSTVCNHIVIVRVDSPREMPGERWPYKKRLIKGVLNHHDARPGSWDLQHGQDGNTGGIWNDVEMLWRADTWIQHIRMVSMKIREDAALVVFRTDVCSAGHNPLPARLRWEIEPPSESKGRTITASQEVILVPGMQSFTQTVHIPDPQLWYSYDAGKQPLYRLRLSLVLTGDATAADSAEMNVGMRTVRLDENSVFYLNGRRLFLRGTNVIPTQWLSTYSKEKIERDIGLLREVNINIVRVHAHITHPDFYDACDRAGILVWQDFALQWDYEPSTEFLSVATSQVRDMVRLLDRHPSVAIWCCHNEPDKSRDVIPPHLERVVRAEDFTRPVLPLSDFTNHPYPGWYSGEMRDFRALPGGPLVTEFGAQALPNVETLRWFIPPESLWQPDWEKWAYHDFQYEPTFFVAGIDKGESIEEFVKNSQEYQARLLRFAIGEYRKAKWKKITGIFQFMFMDCWEAITWAVVDHLRQPKLGYFALKESMTPVFIKIELNKYRFLDNQFAEGRLVAVNDLWDAVRGAHVLTALKDGRGNDLYAETRPMPDLGADCELTDLGKVFEKLNQQDVRFAPGAYTLSVCIVNTDGVTLAEDKVKIEIRTLGD